MCNKDTIESCKNFAIESKRALGPNAHVWIAIQTNALSDRCLLSKDFKEEFNGLVDFFNKDMDFFVPKLNHNMRNSREVAELAKNVKSEVNNRKITDIIDSSKVLLSSITSYKPTLFPMLMDTLSKDYNKVFKHVTEDGSMNVILLSDANAFDVLQIKQSLTKCNVKKDNIFVHTYESKHSKEDIKRFLRKGKLDSAESREKLFLICQDDLFTGMEAKSVVYCITDDDYLKNVRVNLTRACEKLNVIYCYKKDDRSYIDLPRAKMDPTFLVECDKVMTRVAWKCVTCEKIEAKRGNNKYQKEDFVVCRSCSLGCHIGHDLVRKDVRNDLGTTRVDCPCKNESPVCKFKKKSNFKYYGYNHRSQKSADELETTATFHENSDINWENFVENNKELVSYINSDCEYADILAFYDPQSLGKNLWGRYNRSKEATDKLTKTKNDWIGNYDHLLKHLQNDGNFRFIKQTDLQQILQQRKINL